MADLTVSTEAAESARTQLSAVAEYLTLDLRAVAPDTGATTVTDALAQWLSWVALTSGALAARTSSCGDRAVAAAGLLADADRELGRRHGGATTGVQVAR